MSQENINKLVSWIKKNDSYTEEQLHQSAQQNGFNEEDFQAALNIAYQSKAGLEHKKTESKKWIVIISVLIFIIIMFIPIEFPGERLSVMPMWANYALMLLGGSAFEKHMKAPYLFFFIALIIHTFSSYIISYYSYKFYKKRKQ